MSYDLCSTEYVSFDYDDSLSVYNDIALEKIVIYGMNNGFCIISCDDYDNFRDIGFIFYVIGGIGLIVSIIISIFIKIR
jgi:hypothetical protein